MLRQSTTDAPMDPFLSGINEQHARQESADSGLGLGSAYSLPHTPEDFLANIDDNMDGTSGKSGFAQECFRMWKTLTTCIPLSSHPITAFCQILRLKRMLLVCLVAKRVFNSRSIMNNLFFAIVPIAERHCALIDLTKRLYRSHKYISTYLWCYTIAISYT